MNEQEPIIAKQKNNDSFDRRQITRFEYTYDWATLQLARYAAFPMALTPKLLYSLLENSDKFEDELLEEAPWYGVSDLLLSTLCRRIGQNLYEMPASLRMELLKDLTEEVEPDRAKQRINRLSDFMANYIANNFNVEESKERREFVGGEPEWMALACLEPGKLTEKIRKDLQSRCDEKQPGDEFYWSATVESMALLFPDQPLEPLLREFAGEVAAGEIFEIGAGTQGNEMERIKQAIATAGFPLLQSKQIEYAKLKFSDTAVDTGDALYEFEFETVRVDATGEIVQRGQYKAFAFNEPLAPNIALEMVAIPSGKFMMGSPETEIDRWEDEGPQHEVTVRSFFIGKYPITQAQWKSIASTPQIDCELNPNPSDSTGDNLPVENVSWDEAIEFCKRLSRETGRDYRLPTEAEWEYACRAGTTTPFYFGETITGKLANYNSDVIYRQEKKVKSKKQTTPVGTFPPNAFGLYDLHGNVWEWCLDRWHDNYEDAPRDGSAWLDGDKSTNVLRGGSWYLNPRNCRSATRDFLNPDDRYYIIGFRVICEFPRTS